MTNDFIHSCELPSIVSSKSNCVILQYNRIYWTQLDIQLCNKSAIIPIRVKLSGDSIESNYLRTDRFFRKSVVQISICSPAQFCRLENCNYTKEHADHEWQFLFRNFEIINLTVSPLTLLRPRLIFPS